MISDKPNRKLKSCDKHGELEHHLSGNGAYICPKCRSERVAEHRRRVKRRLIDAFGGKCVLCGYNKCNSALEFHHIDPTRKVFTLSVKGSTPNFALIAAEAEKCVLLCANCHREVESGCASIPVDYKSPKIHVPIKEPKAKRVPDPNWRTKPRPKQRKAVRPPLEQIQREVSAVGYCATGRKYGVSDNAVRKWLKTGG